jgi:2-polyprenyl-3-methyl-5-hydroxy-6-metoxy-1,4-benzoquinol methylase
MNVTRALKSELWKRYGSPEHPAEWDGNVFARAGGGKMSQRFWEYFKTIELLDLTPDSVVLDIGGGSPATGVGFLAEILAQQVKGVVVMDPNARKATAKNIECVPADSSYANLKALLETRRDLTHIACVSVFEHIEPAVREGITRAINEAFGGGCFVATFEYHAKVRFHEHYLTAQSVSELFKPMTRFYLDEFIASPTLCENAFDSQPLLRLSRTPVARGHIPLWQPVAARFVRAQT